MFSSKHLLALPAVLLSASGCAIEPAEDGPLGVSRSAALSVNALSVNALSVNALSVNALSVNALSVNALSVNALSVNSLSAIQDPSAAGDLSRELLEYTVGCALNSSQSFNFSYTDAIGVVQSVSYPGKLGVAPDWATGPLTSVSEQELVSGCLAAHTNYFSVHVDISVRNTVLVGSTPAAELAAYPYVEGAFWGNLFTSSPALYACYTSADVGHSRAAQRVCATGYLDSIGNVLPCGMITLTGSCDSGCFQLNADNEYYRGCGGQANGIGNDTTITVGLQ
jgi:hypothetical protein